MMLKLEYNNFKDTDFTETVFLDMFGKYLSQTEAMEVIKYNGQKFYPESNGSKTELNSEGIY